MEFILLFKCILIKKTFLLMWQHITKQGKPNVGPIRCRFWFSLLHWCNTWKNGKPHGLVPNLTSWEFYDQMNNSISFIFLQWMLWSWQLHPNSNGSSPPNPKNLISPLIFFKRETWTGPHYQSPRKERFNSQELPWFQITHIFHFFWLFHIWLCLFDYSSSYGYPESLIIVWLRSSF